MQIKFFSQLLITDTIKTPFFFFDLPLPLEIRKGYKQVSAML